ncbi:hypothetical protein GCM10027431_22180 [Lysobacter rhizosphaerae]
MNYTQDWLEGIMAASGRLETLSVDLREQTQETQAAIRATREQEEARFKQSMVALFQEQQQRTEAALRPKITRAWQVLAALTGVGVLVFGGFLMLLGHANERLKAAQTRVDATEVRAEVQEASRHVEITSCGGRPCIRVDKDTPMWKGAGSEYVLVDGKRGRTSDRRR